MKRILSLIVLLVAFTSCEEDVKFNNPAVQGLKDNELWRATEFTAVKGVDNSLTITATNGFETVVLRAQNSTVGIYQLGSGELSKASYTLDVDGMNMFYTTGTDRGDGAIEITMANTDLTKGYISGNFYFNAEDEDGDLVNFQRGVFYKVRLQTAP